MSEDDEEYEERISIDMGGQGHLVKVKKKVIEEWEKRSKKNKL